MTYTYTIDVIVRARVEVTAESSDVALELAQPHIHLDTDDVRVVVATTDGAEVVEISSDDEGAFEDQDNG